jgi:hypothetical protein
MLLTVEQVMERLARLESEFLADREASRMLSLELEEVKERTTSLLADVPTHPTHAPGMRVQPATPSEYDGDRENGRAFLN